MRRLPARMLSFACATDVLSIAAWAAAPAAAAGTHGRVKHVLLISVDGLHQTDLAWYVANNPGSALASLVASGVEFSNAHTPFPSDSFPGMTGPMTGGNSKSTEI